MTAIAKRKTIIRAETSAIDRKRPLIVELTPYTCIIREKGKRVRYEVSWVSVYHLAAQVYADRVRAERKATRKQRGKPCS